MVKKKKEIKRILIILILTILFFYTNSRVILKTENINIENIISDLKKLEKITDSYIINNNINITSKQLILNYIRNERYNTYWNDLCISTEYGPNSQYIFEEYSNFLTNSRKSLEENNEEKNIRVIYDFSYLKDLKYIETSKGTIDFGLLISSLDALQNNSENIYGNWGYLITESIIKNQDINNAEFNSIIDAKNIYDNFYQGNLSSNLQEYYDSLYNRSNLFLNSFLDFSKDYIYEVYINNKMIYTILESKGIKREENKEEIEKRIEEFYNKIKREEEKIEEKIKVEDINIINIPQTLLIEEKYNLDIEILPENSSNINYKLKTSDKNIIEINENTLIPKKEGKCEISIEIENIIKKYEIEVMNKITLINLEKYEYSLDIGEEDYIKYSFNVVSNMKVKFESTDENIAIVNNLGKIKALSEGVCYIKCILVNNPEIQTQCKVIISKGIEKIENLTETENSIIKMYIEEEKQLKYKVTPEYEKENIIFESDSENVTVDNKGLIKALKPGIVNIKCKSIKNEEIYTLFKVKVCEKIEKFEFMTKTKVLYLNNNKKNITSEISYLINENFNNKNIDLTDIEFKIYKNNNLIPKEYICYENNILKLLDDKLEGDYELRAILRQDDLILDSCMLKIYNNIKEIEEKSNTPKNKEFKPLISEATNKKINNIFFKIIFICIMTIIIFSIIYIIINKKLIVYKIKNLKNKLKITNKSSIKKLKNNNIDEEDDDDLEIYDLEELENMLKNNNKKNDYL